MIEEFLDFSSENKFQSTEASIHLARYSFLKSFVKGCRVLDISCGQGYGSIILQKMGAASVVGVDISKKNIKQAKSVKLDCLVKGFLRPEQAQNVSFINADGEDLPFQNDEFDLVVSLETVEHVDHPKVFLGELRRVCKREGKIVLSCPNDQYINILRPEGNPYHKSIFNFFEFQALTQKILGEGKWGLGVFIQGFANISISNEKLPENVGLPQSVSELFNYRERFSGLVVPSDRYVNRWNARYFIGIFGDINEEFPENFACFASDQFDPEYNVTSQDIREIREMTNAAVIERDRLSSMVRLLKEDNQRLREQSNQLKEQCNQLKEQRYLLEREVNSKAFKYAKYIRDVYRRIRFN